MHRERLTTIIALVVTFIWALVAVVAFVERDYSALTAVTPVMLVVAGFLFGYRERSEEE